MKRIILATHNDHKAIEVNNILKGFEVVSLKQLGWTDEIVEDGLTFQDNAKIKVSAVAAKYPNDLILADDSGLAVNALNGDPGIHSARYAGNDRSSLALCNKLIEELSDVPRGKRNARFVTVLAYYHPENRDVNFFEGFVEGIISKGMIGENGFGYDPIFYIESKGKTMAELLPAEKDLISHRYNALKSFKEYLEH